VTTIRTLEVTALGAHELEPLAEALAAAALPVDDLGEPGRTFFRLEDRDGTVGYGGLEGDGPDRLLRSLVLLPAKRGRGLGGQALAAVEAAARDAGAARLHLLTTGAAPFFRANGYRDAARAVAPPEVQGSRQFAALCPASAAYLVKAL
jgi:amino-acid N-acetyltransferase